MNGETYMLLDIPDTRKETDEWYDCGKVCARAVLQYYYKPIEYAGRLVSTPQHGVGLSDLQACFELAGLHVCQGSMNVELLRRIQNPVILCINTQPYDHYVVYRGIARQRVYTFDPDCGNKSYPIPRFLGLWHSVDRQLRRQYGMIVS